MTGWERDHVHPPRSAWVIVLEWCLLGLLLGALVMAQALLTGFGR